MGILRALAACALAVSLLGSASGEVADGLTSEELYKLRIRFLEEVLRKRFGDGQYACPYCDAEVSKDNPICQPCGAEFCICPACDKPITAGQDVCPHCGAEVKGSKE